MVGCDCAASAIETPSGSDAPSGRAGPGLASARLLPPLTSTTCRSLGTVADLPAAVTTRACTPSDGPTRSGSVAVTCLAAAARASWLPSSGPPSGSDSGDHDDQCPA